MIVVLDTNVIISALLSPSGPPAEIIDHWEADDFDVVTSPPLLSELKRALQYPRVKKYLKRSPDEVATFTTRFRRMAILVEPQFTLEAIEEDPADNRLLECAIAGGASYIVSGDDHLLGLKAYEGMIILSPAGFLLLLGLP